MNENESICKQTSGSVPLFFESWKGSQWSSSLSTPIKDEEIEPQKN